MAVTRNGNVVRMTADNDTITIAKTGFRIAGFRLVAGIDAATASFKETDTNGRVIMSLKANAANATDESAIMFRCDVETLHLDLTGTTPEVFIYLE